MGGGGSATFCMVVSLNNTGARSERARTGTKNNINCLSTFISIHDFQDLPILLSISFLGLFQTPGTVRSVSPSLSPPPLTSDLWPQLSILCGLSPSLRGKYWNEAESNYAIELIARGYHLPNYLPWCGPIEIDTLEYQQTEKIETELKDVDRIHRIRKVYASWRSAGRAAACLYFI